MFKSHNNIFFILVILHFLIGILLENIYVAKLYGAISFLLGLFAIVLSNNKTEAVLKWSLYIVSMDVLMRMTSGFIFSEFSKYAIITYILIALFTEKQKREIQLGYVLYILFLLIGIAFIPFYELDRIRQEVAFNLSGPILLGLSAIYFYNQKINFSSLVKGLKMSVLPLISMVSYLYVKTPNFAEIVFRSAANFHTTAGYGPNQVSTILGFGIFSIIILLIIKKNVTGFVVLDIVVLFYFIYRGLLTFSRGGMLVALIAIAVFFYYYQKTKKHKFIFLLKYFSIVGVILLSVFLFTSSLTNGVLTNRYLNKNTFGEKKEDITSGRKGYLKLELQAFIDNPFWGVGVGGSKYYRDLHTTRYKGSSHNELSRLLSEHGLIGVLSIMLLLYIPIKKNIKSNTLQKAFSFSFFLLWFLTINHSAMRIAFPAFIYGLTLINIEFDEKNFVHRNLSYKKK
jgi:hypothetical protein